VSALGWTNTEKLVVVMEEGSIAKYDIHGNFLKQAILPNVSMYNCIYFNMYATYIICVLVCVVCVCVHVHAPACLLTNLP